MVVAARPWRRHPIPVSYTHLDVYKRQAKGSQWFHELGKVLDESSFGILCLTRQNLGAPWVLYEAGALGKHFGQARVVPLLIDLKMPDLEGRLALSLIHI